MTDSNADNLDDNQFAEQATRFFNGPLEPGDVEAIEKKLSSDPSARQLFVQIATLDGLMTEQAIQGKHPMSLATDLVEDASNSDPSSISLDDATVLVAIRDEDVRIKADEAITLPPSPPAGAPNAADSAPWWFLSTAAKISAAAAMVLIGTLVVIWAMRSPVKVSVAIAPPPIPANNIYVGAAVRAQWDSTSPALEMGDTVPNQPLYLRSGWVRIDFPTGVTAVVEAPAKFQVSSESKVSIEWGRIAADVPVAGHGFALESANCQVIDLGTDFGLAVSEHGQSEVQVFKGQVSFSSKSVQMPPQSELLSAGDGRRLDSANQTIIATVADPAAFVTVQQFDRWVTSTKNGLTDWHAFNEQLSRDPSLMLFYTLDDTDPHTIKNHATRTLGRYDLPTDANSPSWVTGRRPGINALNFDASKQQYLIQQTCPFSQTGELSGTAWIYIRTYVAYGSIAKNWGDLKSGSFHLGLDDTAQHLEIELDGTRAGGPVVRDPIPSPLGQWIHVAFVSDGNTARLYRDGKEVASVPSRLVPTEAPMTCLALGCKTGDDGATPLSNGAAGFWDGQIGEVALFDRALSPQEISHMSAIGRP